VGLLDLAYKKGERKRKRKRKRKMRFPQLTSCIWEGAATTEDKFRGWHNMGGGLAEI
jgi:hypothetical protein